MKTKNSSKNEAVEKLQNLLKITAFNNELKKTIRKEIKNNPNILLVKDEETGELRKVNGYWDSPTVAMLQVVENCINEKGQFLNEEYKREYLRQTARIFAGCYSIAENTYLNKDIKDLEAYIEMLDTVSDEQIIKDATITRENGRLNIDFGGKVDKEVYSILRKNGFLYSPKYQQFTRQHTPASEQSLKRVIAELNAQ